MPYQSPGTAMTSNITFNSGYVTINGKTMAELENVTVEASFAEKELRVLNSILMSTHKRATFKTGLKGKVRSINQEIYGLFFGASAPDPAKYTWTVVDGQQANINVYFTTFVDDDPNKPIQFQFTSAIITALPLSASTEDYGATDFEIVAKNVSLYFGA